MGTKEKIGTLGYVNHSLTFASCSPFLSQFLALRYLGGTTCTIDLQIKFLCFVSEADVVLLFIDGETQCVGHKGVDSRKIPLGWATVCT